MLKQRWNAVKLELVIEPRSPLLIKSGPVSPNPSLPDMQFVRTVTPRGEVVFIPGSSLKGTFRSFTEKVLRTVNEGWACEPFPSSPGYCGKKSILDSGGKPLDEKDKRYPSAVYIESCKACKIYGNTRLRGRISFTDALPVGEIRTETRHGVAISRLTNAVAAGPFDMEVLVQGRFTASVLLENFEIWHLGLVAIAIQAINGGLVRIGFGKNRGFGEVSLEVEQVVVDMVKQSRIPPDTLLGAGSFVTDDERSAYGLRESDYLEGLPEGVETDLAVYLRRIYGKEAWDVLSQKAISSLNHLLEVV